MSSIRIVLASGSQQRLALLRQIGINPQVRISNFIENLDKSLPVTEYVEQTAKGKALSVAKLMEANEYDLVIGCDTVVTIDNQIIGKPLNGADALATLKRLRGRTHQVYTGVALIDSKLKCELFHEKTEVTFSDVPDTILEEYVESGEPIGRAGSYGIQAKGSLFVENINGCYYNVVGLPINRIAKRLWNKVSFFK
uniref:Nucleotide PPase n=1 Tax=Syphacia muris TaxID=451379 RepID=A0A0N5AVM7_9BILA